MSVEQLSQFAQQGGTLYFTSLFIVAAVWAFLPSNKKKFDAAARMPLTEDDQ